MKKRQNITIITAAQGGGKTTSMQKMVVEAQKDGKKIGGFFAPGSWKNGRRHSFELVDLQSREHLPFASREKREEWEYIHSFYFNPQTIQKGQDILRTQAENSDILFIDEIGKFDIKGKLWGSILTELLNKDIELVLCVRDVFVEDVITHFGIKNPLILSTKGQSSE
jgi:nucleoside-triphosphatase THEP1